jgi:hypothetical protein
MTRDEIISKANEMIAHAESLNSKTRKVTRYYEFVIAKPSMANLKSLGYVVWEAEAGWYTMRENGAHHIMEAQKMARDWDAEIK